MTTGEGPISEPIRTMMSSLGMDDMNIPELKINQATGGDYAKESLKANLGQMYVSTTGEVYDQIDLQILMVQRNQTFWGRSDITDEPPICASLDGITSLDGQLCKECQHYRERASLDKEERRKECQRGYVVLALDENQMPYVIRLMGISADAGRDLNAMLYFNKGLRTNRGGFFFRVSTLKKKTAAGEAWMFKFLLLKDRFPTLDQQEEYIRVASDMGMLNALAPAPVPEQITQGSEIPVETDEQRQARILAEADRALGKDQQTISSSEVEKVEDVIPDIKF